MPVELSGDATEVRDADVVVELVREGTEPGSDPAGRAYRAAGFTGRPGEDLLVASDDGTVLLVGVGPAEELDPGAVRRGLARAAPSLLGYPTVGIPLPADAGRGSDVIVAAAEGILLGSHRFDRFRTRSEARAPGRFLLAPPRGTDSTVAEEALAFGIVSAEAGIEARDLANTPANHCTPEDLATHAGSLASLPGLEVEVWREDELERERCGGIIGVGQGSAAPPRLLLLDYRGAGDEPPIALAGKGITFDAGGTSVKHEAHLEWMKVDMAGGAAVLAAMHAIAELRLPVNVVAAIPCADNLTGPTAIKPGDVLSLRSGKTCEIVNTDYEGRVVLADALDVLLERSPAAIVIAATLWGGGEALGEEISPLFGNESSLVQEVLLAAAAAGEPAWQLPLWPPYRRELMSNVADLKNKPADQGAMITAAMFLGEFTGDVPWAYLDLGETAWAGKAWDLGEAGATGVSARTMLRFASARAGGTSPPDRTRS
jgi:leucyl aminopeptidase